LDTIVHRPVFLQEILQILGKGLESSSDSMPALLIDATLGEGGHSEKFLEEFKYLRILGIDRDPVIQEKAKRRLAPYGDRMGFELNWYDDFFTTYSMDVRPDRILFDLGISVFHYSQSVRGFTFSNEETLDMRLDPSQKFSAWDLVNRWGEKELANCIFTFGEERYSRRIAKAIVTERLQQPISTSKQLADIIYKAVPGDYRKGRLHPATKSFQAIRIQVNQELERIERGLTSAFQVLKPGGLLGVISFHSLEDRIVKNLMREWAKKCICPPEQPKCNCGGIPLGQLLMKKPLIPTDQEIRENSPSRSAKLRVIQKLRDQRKDS
jgi:16S rRNA (cytosine1402-N4)-methyltransferase